MKVILQKDGQFGEDGPQAGEHLHLTEIRKIDGDFWAYTVQVLGQDTYRTWIVQLDDLMIPHTEFTETYWSTFP